MSIYPGATHRAFSTDEVSVEYYDGGVKDANSAPVVLIHGTGGRVNTHFFTLYPMLASRRRVIGINLSDKSDLSSDPESRLTLDCLVRQVSAVLEDASPGHPVVLVGYSLGAVVAAKVASELTGRISRLVLLHGWVKTDNALRMRLALWQRLRRENNTAAIAELMLWNVYGRAYLNSKPWSDLQRMQAEYVIGPGSDRQMELNAQIDISADIPKISVPTLVIGGKYDMLIPIGHSLELVGGISNSILCEISCDHASVTERPAELFRIIENFIRHDGISTREIAAKESLVQLSRD